MTPRACIAAALAAAQVALPIVMERGGREAHDVFDADRPSMDGEPAELQLRRVEAWLADPSEQNRAAVERSIDPSRQLNVWDDDLNPPSDAMWWWFLEVGQLAASWGIRIEFVVRDGDRLKELAAVADAHHADAVIVGASTRLGSRLAGSLAVRLVRQRNWPVTVVP